MVLCCLPLAVGTSAAQGEPNMAGIVLDTGSGSQTLVTVAFEGDTISAIDLLERSGLATLTVAFGGLGDGVCMIEDTGCDISACRRTLCQTGADAPFWQFLARDQGSEWAVSALGASSFDVSDGDLTAWIWTADAPNTLPDSFESVLTATGRPAVGTPARFPAVSTTSHSDSRQSWLTGMAMVTVTCALGAGIAWRHKHAAR